MGGEAIVRREAPFHSADELVALGACGEARAPFVMRASAAAAGAAPGLVDRGRDVEGFAVPDELLAGGGDFVRAERGAMGGGPALLVRCAPADDGPAGDQRRARIGERLVDRGADAVEIMAVAADD